MLPNITEKKNGKNLLTVAFIAQKLLFQPFLPISVNFGWLSTLL